MRRPVATECGSTDQLAQKSADPLNALARKPVDVAAGCGSTDQLARR